MAHLMDGHYAPTSVPSSSLPFMTQARASVEEEWDDIHLITPIEWRVVAPRIPSLVTGQRFRSFLRSPRPGLLPMKQSMFFDRPPQERGSSIFWQECYYCSHYSFDCVLPLRLQRRVIQKYEQLTLAEKIFVLTTLYHRVRAIVGAENDQDKLYLRLVTAQHRIQKGSKYHDPIYAQRAEHHRRGLTSRTVR